MRTLIPLALLLVVVVGVVAVVQRSSGRKPAAQGGGADVIAYLLLALAMGVVGFALAQLVATAFPGERFVFDPAEELANSLSALVVASPVAFYLWRRQADRRRARPEVVGWSLYLAVMKLVFLVGFVVAAVMWLDGLFSRGSLSSWPQMVVFGGMVAFHELMASKTPPRSDAAQLPRVIGAAIGWVTAVIGLVGMLGEGALAYLYDTLVGNDQTAQWDPFLAMAIVGLPIWIYEWFRAWPGRPDATRLVWTTVVSVASLLGALASLTVIGAMIVDYLFGEVFAATHFDEVPTLLAVSLVGLASWAEHRRRLGRERSDPRRAYEYAVAGFALATAVGLAFTLTMLVFDRPEIVGGDIGDILAAAFSLVAALGVWSYFDRRWLHGESEFETTSWTRRLYTLGLGLVLALVAAGGLIAILFNLLRMFLDGDEASFLVPVATFVYSGLAAWYLLASYRRDRQLVEAEEVVAPFEVTLVTSHPGMIATKFPKQARLSVIHRGDGVGVIDDEMADSIVSAVANRSSVVWVDQDGFRVAPKRAHP